MTAYSVKHAKHATLTISTVDTVTLTGANAMLEIINRSTSDVIYVRLDGTAPTVAGNETIAIMPGYPLRRHLPVHAPRTVKLISAGAAAYSVQGINE